jgi:hypothetical protein
MAIDVDNVAGQVLAALKGAAGQQTGSAAQALKSVAEDLAAALATIEKDHLEGQLTDQQARALMDAAANAAKAALEGVLAQAEGDIKTIVVAGLQALARVALTAAGLGWAVPILQAAAADL